MAQEGHIKDRLHLPPQALASCVFAAVERDTTGRELSFYQRFNHFPASPLCAVSLFYQGESFAVSQGRPLDQPLPKLLFTGPMDKPYSSWNSGPVQALTIGFFPEAWAALTGRSINGLINAAAPVDASADGALLDIFQKTERAKSPREGLKALELALAPVWQNLRPSEAPIMRVLADWSHAIAARAMTSNVGRSVRQGQRRVKSWTGQSQRSLEGFGRIEALHELSLKGRAPLADLAQDGGFSDQSHMGREVRRVTGRSPADLRHLIEFDEAFWVYRLLGERF